MPMTREIIHVQVGQCGNQMGTRFWEEIIKEHGLCFDGTFCSDDDISSSSSSLQSIQKDKVGVYFSETSNGRFVPRSVLVDLEPGVLDGIRSRPSGSLFRPDNFIHGQSGAGNNWAKGHFTEGADHVDAVTDVVRREAENCDSMQGFQVCHSLGGGTGSGMGTLLISRLREEFPDKMMTTFSVIPSPTESNQVVEPYNTILSLHQLIENADSVVCLDNRALFDICSKTLKVVSPHFNDLNHLVAKVICGVTASLRFPGELNSDLRKLAVNLVPFPRLHFFLTGLAPLTSSQNLSFRRLTIGDLVQQLFSKGNMMAAVDSQYGTYLSASALFRGPISTKEVEDNLHSMLYSRSNRFVEWIPHNLQSAICKIAPPGEVASATLLANSTSVREVFGRNLIQFQAMFKRRAFTFWYYAEGMSDLDFTEAEANVNDLMLEYQHIETASDDEDEGEEVGTAPAAGEEETF